MSQSETPNNTSEEFKEWVKETCMTREAIHGNGNSKYQCPMLYLGYNNALKFKFGSNGSEFRPSHRPWCELFVGTNITFFFVLFTDLAALSASLVKGKWVAMHPPEDGTSIPTPVQRCPKSDFHWSGLIQDY